MDLWYNFIINSAESNNNRGSNELTQTSITDRRRCPMIGRDMANEK